MVLVVRATTKYAIGPAAFTQHSDRCEIWPDLSALLVVVDLTSDAYAATARLRIRQLRVVTCVAIDHSLEWGDGGRVLHDCVLFRLRFAASPEAVFAGVANSSARAPHARFARPASVDRNGRLSCAFVAFALSWDLNRRDANQRLCEITHGRDERG